ncbi:MAG: hypothetical protein M3O62_13280 [Pseudomonadota bacterium]|nr:hypothetical protein [Pseudomonadota bacterium]
MRAGIGFGSALALGVLLTLPANSSLAAEPNPVCQAYANSQWSPVDATSISGCLLRLDAATTVYDGQGFKFGLWGNTLLSADVTYFYRSMDSGASWQVVGTKASISPAPAAGAGSGTAVAQTERPVIAPTPKPAAIPTEKPVATPAASAGTFARITDFFTAAGDPPPASSASEEVLTPKPVTADMPAPATVARTESVGQNSVLAAAPASTQPPAPVDTISQVAPQASEPRNSCNMRLGSLWEVVKNQTLQQCIALFDRSPDQFDANGYKFGYWGGIYLAADRKEVLQSTDSRDWTTVLTR